MAALLTAEGEVLELVYPFDCLIKEIKSSKGDHLKENDILYLAEKVYPGGNTASCYAVPCPRGRSEYPLRRAIFS